jgi:hypothetical protein
MTTEPTPADSTSTNITAQAPLPPAPSIESPPTPAAPEVAPTWPLKADFAILAMLLIFSFFLASFVASNSDLWLHLAIGKRISEGNFAFGVDPYSWATEAFGGKPAVYWVHHSWLFSLLVYQIYSFFGGAGLVIVKAILFTATIGLLARVGWREENRWFAVICLVMAAMAASTRLVLHPIVVSLLFLSVTLFVLAQVGIFAMKRDESAPDRTRWLWYLPPLFALWANLDDWFILGPLVLGCCWLGSGLAKWYPNGNPIPGKTIGMVFGVSLLACVVNPHHVHVFQLPSELAYLVLSVGEPIGIPLPDSLVAAGRTAKELTRIEVNAPFAISSLSSSYWQNPNLGMNAAGIAYYPLLILGLVAFTLVALVKPQAGAPSLQVNRFVPWLLFAVLSLALYRLIPVFVIVAAPLTAITLGEFLSWQQTSNAVAAARRDRGLNLARLVSLPFMLLLLYLAWPGWLHGSGGTAEFSSPRRVAWDIRPDSSYQQAVEALGALKRDEPQKCGNVFNTSREAANYFPWYAPDVKYYMDTRLSLYVGQASAYDKARRALSDTTLPASDWQTLFKERHIDQLFLVNFMTDKAKNNLLRWWLDADRWRQQYGDMRTLLLSWAPGEPWPIHTGSDALNRQAFGPVPEDKRPPKHGPPAPQPQTIWTLYLNGVPPTPALVSECLLQQQRFSVTGELMNNHFRTCSVIFMTGSVTSIQGLPGSVIRPALEFQLQAGRNVPALDAGPPALPILMVRGARRAVAENPLDASSHYVLRIANEVLRNEQEDYWMGFQKSGRGQHPSLLRDRMRRTQLNASAYQVAQLQPENPDHHQLLAELYIREHMRDLALEHMQLAFKGHQTRMASGKYGVKTPKEQEAVLKQYHEKLVDPLEKSVRQRLAQFKDNSDKLTPFNKVNYALREQFQEFREGGVERTPLGLGKKALDLLLEIDPKTLAQEEERAYLLMRFELLLAMGRVDVVADNLKLESVRAILPEAMIAQYQVFTAGALGDYETLDEALSVIEKQQRENLMRLKEGLNARRSLCVPSMFLAPALPSGGALSVAVMLQTIPALRQMNDATDQSDKMHNDLFNTITLRGTMALEAGATRRARTLFQSVLTEAGAEHYFSDRAIASRYRDLLNQQGQ